MKDKQTHVVRYIAVLGLLVGGAMVAWLLLGAIVPRLLLAPQGEAVTRPAPPPPITHTSKSVGPVNCQPGTVLCASVPQEAAPMVLWCGSGCKALPANAGQMPRRAAVLLLGPGAENAGSE